VSENRTGRVDLLVKDGLGMIADRFGVRDHVQRIIDRFVDENIERNRVPVSPEEIAENMGILRKRKRSRLERM
jgi:hypothetical protein